MSVRAISLVLLSVIFFSMAVHPTETKEIVSFKRNMDTVFREWSCRNPKRRLVYLGKYQLSTEQVNPSTDSFECCISLLQKMNSTTTIRVLCTYHTPWSFPGAKKQSGAANLVRFAHQLKKKRLASRWKCLVAVKNTERLLLSSIM